MLSAVDTSVLLDVFTNDPVHCAGSAQALRECMCKGQLVVSEIVWAKLAAVFPSESALRDAVAPLSLQFLPMTVPAASLAGTYWRLYRKRGGERNRVIADFLIGAHALVQADRLVTRDRGFYRDYFSELTIVDPAAGRHGAR